MQTTILRILENENSGRSFIPIDVSPVEMLQKLKFSPVTRLQFSSSMFSNKYNNEISHCPAGSQIFMCINLITCPLKRQKHSHFYSLVWSTLLLKQLLPTQCFHDFQVHMLTP